jgi:hypothetical protein
MGFNWSAINFFLSSLVNKTTLSMNLLFLTTGLIISLISSVYAQKAVKNSDDLKINGVRFYAVNKKTILKVFGKPIKKFDPHYECGFLSDEQGEAFYTLEYKSLKWTGNTKSGYLMENLLIQPNASYHITYNGRSLSSHTTIKEFIALTGVHTTRIETGLGNPTDLLKLFKNPNLKTNSVELQDKGADDKYIFYFFHGQLCKIEYWSPC